MYTVLIHVQFYSILINVYQYMFFSILFYTLDSKLYMVRLAESLICYYFYIINKLAPLMMSALKPVEVCDAS